MTRTCKALLLLVLLTPLLACSGDVNQDLVEAAKKGDTAVVRVLLANGADVTATDHDGWTPLMWAAYAGHTDAVKALLCRSTNPSSAA